jgi:hypothetical protein
MITEEAYSPYFFKIKLDGKLTYEMKGTELRNDFMSGPLLITQYLTKKTIGVVFEGFCYSPSKEKRDLMHQLNPL